MRVLFVIDACDREIIAWSAVADADAPIAEMASRAAAENVSLFDHSSLLRSTLIQQALLAASVNDRHALAALSGKAVEVLKETGRLTDEVSRITSVTNNLTVFTNSPIFLDLQSMLLTRLAPHPAALQAVRGLSADRSRFLAKPLDQITDDADLGAFVDAFSARLKGHIETAVTAIHHGIAVRAAQ